MRWGRAAVFVIAGLAPGAAFGEGFVQSANGRVDLRATASPLSEILDRLARATGMKVVNEGPPPRQPLTVTLAGRTPAEAVLGVLDGLGLNYALKMDMTGTRVETLILSGTAPPAAATAPVTPAPIARPPQPVAPQVEAEEEAPAEEEAEEPDESQQPQRPGVKAPKEAAEEGQTNAPGPVMRPTFPMMPGGQPFPVSPFAPVPPPPPTPAPPASAVDGKFVLL